MPSKNYTTKTVTTIVIDTYKSGFKYHIPFHVPYGQEGIYGDTYSMEDGTLTDLLDIGTRVFADGVELENIIAINPIEKWVLCGTGKFNYDTEEFVNYRINGVITWELPSNAK